MKKIMLTIAFVLFSFNANAYSGNMFKNDMSFIKRTLNGCYVQLTLNGKYAVNSDVCVQANLVSQLWANLAEILKTDSEFLSFYINNKYYVNKELKELVLTFDKLTNKLNQLR